MIKTLKEQIQDLLNEYGSLEAQRNTIDSRCKAIKERIEELATTLGEEVDGQLAKVIKTSKGTNDWEGLCKEHVPPAVIAKHVYTDWKAAAEEWLEPKDLKKAIIPFYTPGPEFFQVRIKK